VAVTSGIIELVIAEDLWDPVTDNPADRSGLAVGLIGDDGIRYYGSHLQRVDDGIVVGMRVTAGQFLGEVGRSGNARTTPAHLHFGISRPTTPDDWQTRRGQISPYPFLQAWAQGENLAPLLADIPLPE
jgi:murein DD-endopeptidase MepM/ murein hydrolase activator NlpD